MAAILLLLALVILIYLVNSLLQEFRQWFHAYHKVNREALDSKPLVVDSEEVPEDVE